MDIERERGITIKAQTVRLDYKADDGADLRPQPDGHPRPRRLRLRGQPLAWPPAKARSWSSTPRQGVEAQTLANVYQAIDADHEIVPVLNKIDLPAAEPERVAPADRGRHRHRRLRRRADARAKTGLGIHDVLEAIVTRLPAAQGRPRRAAEGPAGRRLVRRLPRRRRAGPRLRRHAAQGPTRIKMMQTGAALPGRPHRRLHAQACSRSTSLGPGEIGFITAQIKEVADAAVGDTITDERKPHRRRRCPASSDVAAGGVLRPVPGRRRRLRGPARRHRQAAPQRRQLHLRDGDQRRARLRLPLRLPGPAAPGDHPGAARARVRPRPDRHRAPRWSTRST